MTPAIRIDQPIAASRAQIWAACSTPEGFTRWQSDNASGEIREGRRLVLRYPAFGAEVRLDVVEQVPEQRLVLRGELGRVELDLRDGGISLVHTEIDDRADRDGLQSSWQLTLAQLAHSVERHPNEPRTVCWLMRRVPGAPAFFHLCFTDSSCLPRWLGAASDLGAAGTAYTIGNEDSLMLRGVVRVNVPGRDVALTCENLRDSMLAMRTLPSPTDGNGRIVALSWSVWGKEDPAWLMPTVEALEGALDDLKTFANRVSTQS